MPSPGAPVAGVLPPTTSVGAPSGRSAEPVDDPNDYSATDVSDLGASAARGATATLAGQVLRAGLQALSLIGLARILAPSDFGLVAEIVAIVGVGEIIREFGLSSAAMQATRVTIHQRTNLFWINTGIGAGLGLIALMAAPAIADLYGDPNLVGPARVIALAFVFNGAAAQFQADLNRKLKFGRVAFSDVGSQLLAFGVAVALALGGAGYWALVAQQVGQTLAALLILVVLDDWRPGLPRRNAGMRQFWRYGWGLMGGQLLGYLTRNIDSVIIGYRFGTRALGFYERAFQVLMLPLNQINAPATRVALPVLARLQNDSRQFQAYLLRGQTVLTNVTMAVFAYGIALAQPLFDLVFGTRWHASIHLFQILAVGGIFQAVSYPAYWAFLATGRTGAALGSALITRPMVALGIIVGSHWGVTGVAVGYTIGLGTIWPVELYWMHRSTPVSGAALARSGLRPMVFWLGLAAAIDYGLSRAHLGDGAALALGSLAFAAGGVACYVVFAPFRRDIRAIRATVGLLASRGPVHAAA